MNGIIVILNIRGVRNQVKYIKKNNKQQFNHLIFIFIFTLNY
jgi:hypothetical protein